MACVPPAQGLTPYQGTSRCFGEFRCDGCDNSWSSANSWRDKFQRCRECESDVYPYTQRPLNRAANNEKRPPHDQANCEMCILIGFSCRQLKTTRDCNYSCECGREWYSPNAGPLKCRSCGHHVHSDDASDSEDDVSDEESCSGESDGGGLFVCACGHEWEPRTYHEGEAQACSECGYDAYPDGDDAEFDEY